MSPSAWRGVSILRAACNEDRTWRPDVIEAVTPPSQSNPRWRDYRADGVPRRAWTEPPPTRDALGGVSFAGRPSPVPLDGGTADTIRRSGDARQVSDENRGVQTRQSEARTPPSPARSPVGRLMAGSEAGTPSPTGSRPTFCRFVSVARGASEPIRRGVGQVIVHVVGRVVDRFRMANARPLPSRGPGARLQGSKAREDRAANRRPRTRRLEPHSAVQTPPLADERTAASMKAMPSTPSSTVGKITPAGPPPLPRRQDRLRGLA